MGELYLLVEERFAHGPGNGAWGRARNNGFGHCEYPEHVSVSFDISIGKQLKELTYWLNSSRVTGHELEL